MKAKVTRRQLGAALAGAGTLLAQAPVQPPALPKNPEEEVAAARDRNRATGAQLDKFDLPMQTEPAVHFKA